MKIFIVFLILNISLHAGMGEGTLQVGILVNITDTEFPFNYELKQNYPNPFNPSTKIQFSLPNSETIKLVIFDVLGNKIEDLINSKELRSGTYELTWSASEYSSGIYFYSLITQNKTITKKMLLLR